MSWPAKLPSPLETRLALASWARAEQAKGIVEAPRGSNKGPPFDLYAMPGEQALPWCSRFVRTGLLLFDALGGASPGMLYDMASARMMYRHLVLLGGDVVRSDEADEGDLRFLAGRGGSDPLMTAENVGGIHHVGVVVARASPGMLAIVDGNWGDELALNHMATSDPLAVYLRFPKASP